MSVSAETAPKCLEIPEAEHWFTHCAGSCVMCDMAGLHSGSVFQYAGRREAGAGRFQIGFNDDAELLAALFVAARANSSAVWIFCR